VREMLYQLTTDNQESLCEANSAVTNSSEFRGRAAASHRAKIKEIRRAAYYGLMALAGGAMSKRAELEQAKAFLNE